MQSVFARHFGTLSEHFRNISEHYRNTIGTFRNTFGTFRNTFGTSNQLKASGEPPRTEVTPVSFIKILIFLARREEKKKYAQMSIASVPQSHFTFINSSYSQLPVTATTTPQKGEKGNWVVKPVARRSEEGTLPLSPPHLTLTPYLPRTSPTRTRAERRRRGAVD
jgi:hypothetical protein